MKIGDTFEVRAGHTDMGPHPLQDWSFDHDFRDFDLSSIVSFVEIEDLIQRLLIDTYEGIGDDSSKVAEFANNIAFARGYKAIFNLENGKISLTEDAKRTLKTFFRSPTWEQQSVASRPSLNRKSEPPAENA